MQTLSHTLWVPEKKHPFKSFNINNHYSNKEQKLFIFIRISKENIFDTIEESFELNACGYIEGK